MSVAEPHARPDDPIGAALAHLASTQDASGSWKGDYGGPLFLLPIFIATARTVGFALDAETRAGMETYLRTRGLNLAKLCEAIRFHPSCLCFGME